MPEPAAWMLEEETETDRLRMALAEARADLQRRDAALLRLQGELMASRLEVAGARGETVQFQGMLRRSQEAEATTAQAWAELESANSEIAQLHADVAALQSVIATLQAEIVVLRGGMDLLRASASWRMSAPIRLAGRLMRRIRAAGLRLLRANRRTIPRQAAPVAQPPAALPSLGDPNARAIFQAAPFADHPAGEAEGVVTLDGLYHLSRSL